MQSTNTQSADYASLSIPGTDTQSINAQAVTLLASVKANIKREPEILEEFDRENFELRLSSVFNQNAVINSIRAARHPKSLLREIERAFYNFKTVTFLFETNVPPELENAVITLIANAALKKRDLSLAPAEIKKPVIARQLPAIEHEKPAPPQTAEKNKDQETADKKRLKDESKAERKRQRKIDLEVKKEEDRKTLDLMRPLMEETQAQLMKESMLSEEHDPVKTKEVAEQVLTYISRALELKLVNVMGAQKYLAIAFRQAFNHHAGLAQLEIKKPKLAKKTRERFRHILIASTRLKVKLNPHVKSAIINVLIQEEKNRETVSRLNARNNAIKNGQTASARETARKTMIEWRNDPEKTAERAKKIKRRLEVRRIRRKNIEIINSNPELIAKRDKRLALINADPTAAIERLAILNADPAFIAASSERMKRMFDDPKFVAATSERMKKLHKDPQFAAAHAQRLKKLHANPEFAKAASDRLKKLHATPEFKKRLAEGRAKRSAEWAAKKAKDALTAAIDHKVLNSETLALETLVPEIPALEIPDTETASLEICADEVLEKVSAEELALVPE